MRAQFLTFSLLLSAHLVANPYIVEPKIQTDLEGLLSKIMPANQYLVQVTSKIKVKNERRLVENETFVQHPGQKVEKPPEPMPGFIPDSKDSKPVITPPSQTRQRYEMVEKPNLQQVLVNVSFDNNLNPEIINQGQKVVRDYMFTNYPEVGRLKFNRIPMVQPKKEEPLPVPPPAEPTFEELMLKWGPWAALGILLLWMLFRRREDVAAAKLRAEREAMKQSPVNVNFGAGVPNNEESEKSGPKVDPAREAAIRRNRFMSKVIAHAPAFRNYYEKLEDDRKAELEAILQGPAFDSFMTSLEIKRAEAEENMQDPEERGEWHEIQFDEFVQANKWEQKQFFGFLKQLTKEQLISLASFEDDITVCLMLRFIKPNQSAQILDSLTPERRAGVLSQLNAVHNMPLSEIDVVEKRVRSAIGRLPPNMLGPGKQESQFWGNVLDESTHVSEILEEIERTSTDIYKDLKKYRFSLEDAASLPDEYLSKVVSETDNEELCMALTTVDETVASVILDNVSERRREVLEQQMAAAKNADPDKIAKARSSLTKKIREAMSNA